MKQEWITAVFPRFDQRFVGFLDLVGVDFLAIPFDDDPALFFQQFVADKDGQGFHIFAVDGDPVAFFRFGDDFRRLLVLFELVDANPVLAAMVRAQGMVFDFGGLEDPAFLGQPLMNVGKNRSSPRRSSWWPTPSSSL